MSVKFKICGLSTQADISAACRYGASFVGVVFFPKSPRHVSFAHAAEIMSDIPDSCSSVAVMVNPDDDTLEAMMNAFKPDYIQLHGNEPAKRVYDIRKLTGRSIIKALSVRTAEDLEHINDYENDVDFILFDAKPSSSDVPGGHGQVFDWSLIASINIDTPWFLAGGINADNVLQAIQETGAQYIDVSSAVEIKPGVKSERLIKQFLETGLSL